MFTVLANWCYFIFFGETVLSVWNVQLFCSLTAVILVVDRKYETVILPVYGVSTPFHISTIKVLSCLLQVHF